MSQRCYILGAGFSKPFGLPLACELTEQVFEHLAARDDPAIADFIAPALEAWKGFLRKLYPKCDLDTAWPDFEDLITVLDEWEQYRAGFENASTPQGPMQPAHLKDTLLKHLALRLSEIVASKHEGAISPVRRFVSVATGLGHSVISFNWDLLLEAAAADAGIQVSYGGVTKGGLEVSKPHGSLNLAEADKEEFERWLDTSMNIRNVIVDFEHNHRVVVRANDPRDVASRIVHPFKETLLVEPTARKAYGSPWLTLQWRRALEMVRAADEIVVIGFSLPPTDFRPRVLLQLAGLNRSPQPSITLVAPNATDLLGRYEMWVQKDINAESRSWIDWFRDQDGS